MTRRLSGLKGLLAKKRIDSFLVTNPVNIFYISGLKTENSCLLITRDSNFIITDFRYAQEAQALRDFQLRLIKKGLLNTLKTIAKERRMRSIGFEGGHLSYQSAATLKKGLGQTRTELKPFLGTIEWLRQFKDSNEIAAIRKASVVTHRALALLKPRIRPGISEKALARDLDLLMRKSGGEKNAFDSIVASGKNSSRPHASVTDDVIGANDLVLIDAGAVVASYNSDLTRIFILGKIQRVLYETYNICREAQARAIRKIKPGAPIRDVDSAARGYINSKGYGKNFGHALGHGIGLEVHELPSISSSAKGAFKAGMVVTVEPGIYLAGVGGARIEDTVLVTDKGCEVLTDDIPK